MVQEKPLCHIQDYNSIIIIYDQGPGGAQGEPEDGSGESSRHIQDYYSIIIIYDQGPGGAQGDPEDGTGESALSHLGGPNPKTRCHFLLSLINRLVLLKNVVFFCEHGTKDLLRFVYLFYILICYRYIRAC